MKKLETKRGGGTRARTRAEFGTINKRHLPVGEFDSKLQDGRSFRSLERGFQASDTLVDARPREEGTTRAKSAYRR